MTHVTPDKILEATIHLANEEYRRIQKEIYIRIESRDRMFNSLLFIIAATIGAISWIISPTGGEGMIISSAGGEGSKSISSININDVGIQLFLIGMVLSGSSLVCSSVCLGFVESNSHIYAAARYVLDEVIKPTQTLLSKINADIAVGPHSIAVTEKWWNWESFINSNRKEQKFSDKSHGSVWGIIGIVFAFIVLSILIDAFFAMAWRNGEISIEEFSYVVIISLCLGCFMVLAQGWSLYVLIRCFILQWKNGNYIKKTGGWETESSSEVTASTAERCPPAHCRGHLKHQP